jgi:predicted Zn-dependent protease
MGHYLFMQYAVVALILLLGACNPLTIPVYVHESEDERLITAVADEVDWWNEQIGMDILESRVVGSFTRVPFDGMCLIVQSRRKTVMGDDKTDANTVNLLHVRHIYVENNEITNPENSLNWLLAHELGHALGLIHIDTPDNLMYGNQTVGESSIKLTKQQIRRVRAAVGLSAILL